MIVRVGIVGCGDGGMLNLKALQGLGAEVIAFCDLNQMRLDQVRTTFPSASFYTDAKELSNTPDINLVVVATPDNQHLGPAVAALETGKAVFIEKPVATTLEDLRIFLSLADVYPNRLVFSENQSFTYPIEQMLKHKKELGSFMLGTTFYVLGGCDRIMGGGKWRTEHAYNPAAGGLSHNFMVALLLADAPIVRVRATGSVLTYHENLDHYEGYDSMEGTLEFATGRRLNWHVCIALRSHDTLFGQRDIAHLFQFEQGALTYSPYPSCDKLVVRGHQIVFQPEPESTRNKSYFDWLYTRMHEETLAALSGKPTRHTIHHGINVAAACALAFQSAKKQGAWLDIPTELTF